MLVVQQVLVDKFKLSSYLTVYRPGSCYMLLAQLRIHTGSLASYLHCVCMVPYETICLLKLCQTIFQLP